MNETERGRAAQGWGELPAGGTLSGLRGRVLGCVVGAVLVASLAGVMAQAWTAHPAGHQEGTLLKAGLLAGGMALLVTLLVVELLLRRWLAPLVAMLEAVQALAAERRPEPVPQAGPLADLAGGFNAMTERLLFIRGQLGMQVARLEIKVRHRTAELEATSQRLAAEVQAKNAFLRSVTHDLKAPLRNIEGLAALLLRKHAGNLEPDVRHKLERIVANAQHQNDLIGDLLELSRLTAPGGRRQLVASRSVAEDVGRSFLADLEREAIELQVAGTEEAWPELWVEKTRLRQVFQNLVDNAIKYMGPRGEATGARRIVLRALDPEPVDEEALLSGPELPAAWHFAVEDTGPGIPPGDLPHVFDVFRRGTSPAAQAREGRGIGLATVRSIVEQYGGQIRAENLPEGGARMRFSLAMDRVAPPEKEADFREKADRRLLVLGAVDAA